MADIQAQLTQFFSQFPERRYNKGQIMVFGGETPEHIYYLVEGRVRMYDVSPRGDEVIVNVFKPPAFFPMSWAINRSANQFFYKTEVASHLHVAPADQTLQFIKDHPDVMLDLLSRLYRGMDGVLGRLVQLMGGTARSRLLYELNLECQRFGQPVEGGGCQLTISETDLAARTGLSRETISREIHKTKTDGLVTVNQTGLLITDLAKLQRAV
jgi:CRP-like cAMP-binding protein